jgi:hypothetical protein
MAKAARADADLKRTTEPLLEDKRLSKIAKGRGKTRPSKCKLNNFIRLFFNMWGAELRAEYT